MRQVRGLPTFLARLSQYLRNKLNHIRQQGRHGGNRGVSGSVTAQEAFILGEHFVGSGYRHTEVGLMSADGLRQFRLPSTKDGINRLTGEPWSRTGMQSNFETRAEPKGPFQSNVHLDVIP